MPERTGRSSSTRKTSSLYGQQDREGSPAASSTTGDEGLPRDSHETEDRERYFQPPLPASHSLSQRVPLLTGCRSPSQDRTVTLPERLARRETSPASRTDERSHAPSHPSAPGQHRVSGAVTIIPPGSSQDTSGITLSSGTLRWDQIFPARPATVERTVHMLPMCVVEHHRPHIHTYYHPERRREIHVHEHRNTIQPVLDDEEE